MRASRLLSILLLLQTRGRMTAEMLAAEFEVSVRTIYRDIDQLRAAGAPVYEQPDQRYVAHCHILEHEDAGMMAKIQVIPAAPAP